MKLTPIASIVLIASIISACTPQVAAPPNANAMPDAYYDPNEVDVYAQGGAGGQGGYNPANGQGGYDPNRQGGAYEGGQGGVTGYGPNGQGGRGGQGQHNGQGGRGGQGQQNGQQGQGGGVQGQYGNGGANQGGRGAGQYTPADLRNPSSILAQRIIYFDYDQAHIRPEYVTILNAHAALLAAYPELRVRLEGHADERGTREYNVALSEQRGKTVRDFLRLKGVRAQQMEVIGYGEEVPASFGQDEKSWEKNRRVELIYSGD